MSPIQVSKKNRAAIADHIVAGKIPESLDDPDEKGIIITKQIATLRIKMSAILYNSLSRISEKIYMFTNTRLRLFLKRQMTQTGR